MDHRGRYSHWFTQIPSIYDWKIWIICSQPTDHGLVAKATNYKTGVPSLNLGIMISNEDISLYFFHLRIQWTVSFTKQTIYAARETGELALSSESERTELQALTLSAQQGSSFWNYSLLHGEQGKYSFIITQPTSPPPIPPQILSPNTDFIPPGIMKCPANLEILLLEAKC